MEKEPFAQEYLYLEEVIVKPQIVSKQQQQQEEERGTIVINLFEDDEG